MARILTGIQSTGVPHLGNILGAILPAIKMSNEPGNESFLFIADWHSLTQIKEGNLLRENTYSVAATWLAFDFDVEKNTFYRQSDVTEVAELTWYLNCFTPYPMLANAHSFKDKSSRLADVNAGLFTYPVLMAADILLYDANFVPVGKDQVQHLEMTRDIASAVNNKCGAELLVLPEVKIDEQVMVVPGTDGQKMSKSYNNTINIFLPEKELKKNIMGIVTDATPLEEPKNPDTCNVFKLFSLLADANAITEMRANYLKGGYGYGHAKNELLNLILTKFSSPREKYISLMNDKNLLDKKLAIGAEKARVVARETIRRIREKLGY